MSRTFLTGLDNFKHLNDSRSVVYLVNEFNTTDIDKKQPNNNHKQQEVRVRASIDKSAGFSTQNIYKVIIDLDYFDFGNDPNQSRAMNKEDSQSDVDKDISEVDDETHFKMRSAGVGASLPFRDIFADTFKEITRTPASRFINDTSTSTGLYNLIQKGLNHLYRCGIKNYGGYYRYLSNDLQEKGTISAVSLNDDL